MLRSIRFFTVFICVIPVSPFQKMDLMLVYFGSIRVLIISMVSSTT